jgi:hypothetical protein
MDALYNVEEERDARIVEWRMHSFHLLGIDELTSSSLAVRRDIDRALVERMVIGGATTDELRAILL